MKDKEAKDSKEREPSVVLEPVPPPAQPHIKDNLDPNIDVNLGSMPQSKAAIQPPSTFPAVVERPDLAAEKSDPRGDTHPPIEEDKRPLQSPTAGGIEEVKASPIQSANIERTAMAEKLQVLPQNQSILPESVVLVVRPEHGPQYESKRGTAAHLIRRSSRAYERYVYVPKAKTALTTTTVIIPDPNPTENDQSRNRVEESKKAGFKYVHASSSLCQWLRRLMDLDASG